MAATRPHVAHTEDDVCPECGLPWTEWPMAHKGDVVCGQRCEKAGEGGTPGVPSDEPTADPSDC